MSRVAVARFAAVTCGHAVMLVALTCFASLACAGSGSAVDAPTYAASGSASSSAPDAVPNAIPDSPHSALGFTPAFSTVGNSADAAPVVKQFPLDERTVYEIPISVDAPTTVLFPSAPTALESAGISMNPEQHAPVLLSHVPGRYYFSVRAMRPDARATLNVIHKSKAYIIRFRTSSTPFGTITFYEDNIAGKSSSLAQRATPETLLALLDRAKSYRLIHAQYPEAVQQIEHRVPTQNNVTRYRNFTATVEEVFRFEVEDTLVFRLRLQNTSAAEITYRPRNLATRVGHRIYPASIADASGLIPPRSESIAYFAITGAPNGARAHLSVKNDFTILVPRIAPRGGTSHGTAPREQRHAAPTPVPSVPVATPAPAQSHEAETPQPLQTPVPPSSGSIAPRGPHNTSPSSAEPIAPAMATPTATPPPLPSPAPTTITPAL